MTLACEDKHKIEAHKVILAVSSPVFRELLQNNKNSHPLLYTRLKVKHLNAIMDFVYYEEVNIYQRYLNNFMVIAEELELKGLPGSVNEELNSEGHSKPNY